METQKFSLHLDTVETLLVTPSQVTPSEPLCLSSLDNHPYVYRRPCDVMYAYRANNNSDRDPAYVIQEALSKVLVYYYPMAGMLKRNDDGQLEVCYTGAGVPFAKALSNCTLEYLQYLEGIDYEIVRRFLYQVDQNKKDDTHPLTMQVTKFACGGFTLGISISHSLCDGIGCAMFIRALTKLASGMAYCTLKPVWERERLTGNDAKEITQPIINRGAPAISPLPATDLVHASFNLTSDCIKKLKIGLLKESGDASVSFTTVEVLGAYIWRSWFRALERNLDRMTTLKMSVGIRHVLDPPLPEGYYGNVILFSSVDLLGKELSEGTLFRVVMLIKDCKRDASTQEYIQSYMQSLLSSFSSTNKLRRNGATMLLTDWRNLGLLEQADFGWKEAVNMISLPWMSLNVCYLMSPCPHDPSMKGGVKVVVCLPQVAINMFKQEMDVLLL